MSRLEKIRIGIIGAGSIARAHAAAFGAIEEVQIEAICSRSPAKAAALASELKIPSFYASIDSMFRSHKLDIVIIAVSITSTKNVCLECFDYPALFLIEKPLGLNLEEAYEIRDYAKKKDVQAYIALNRRFYSSTRKIKADLDNAFGSIFVKVQDQEDLISAAKDGHPEEVLKNWMYANSIHLIDLMSFFARAPIRKIVKFGSIPTSYSDFSTYHALIDYENGDVAEYEGIWNAQGPWALTITTGLKRFECKPLEMASFQNFPARTKFDYPIDDIDRKFKPGFFLQALHTVKALKKQHHDLPDLDEGLETTKLVHQLFF